MFKAKFLISEMAEFHKLSAKTLRYYDSIGLFKPKFTDSETKYRYYTLDQFEILEYIIFLKSLGIKLKEIRSYINNFEPDKDLIKFKTRLELVEKEIKHLTCMKNKLKTSISHIENYLKTDKKDHDIFPKIKNLTKAEILKVTVRKPYNELNFEMAVKELLYAGKEMKFGDYYRVGDILDLDRVLRNKKIVSKEIYLEVSKGNSKIDKGIYASLVHKGKIDTIRSSVIKLLNFISSKSLVKTGDLYMVFLTDPLIVRNEEKFITELFIKVDKKTDP